MIRTTLLLTLCASLGACGLFGNRNPARNADTENQLPFRAKLNSDDADARNFIVSVDLGARRQPEASDEPLTVDDLRESARFEATKYCILAFGGSDIDWVIDPQTDDWALNQQGDVLNFEGRCTVR